MHIKIRIILCWILAIPLFSFAQKVENIHFEQVEKQIHIYYDLEGSDTYTVELFCSTEYGQNWGTSLKYVTGEVGEGQKPGNGKMIVWDVLKEREKLSGEILFRIEVVNIDIFTDNRDRKTYKLAKIGNQIWLAENLNYKTRNSWCYDNKETNCKNYGRLYNWNAAQSVCPKGWHLPTDDEWKTLEMFLGMSKNEVHSTRDRGTDEGKKLKSKSGWHSGRNGTDTFGINVLPGGFCTTDRRFSSFGYRGYWWSATVNGSSWAWSRTLNYNNDKVYRNYDKKEIGFSVRCVRD